MHWLSSTADFSMFDTHLEIGTTSRISIPTLELCLSCFTNPLSMMYLYEEVDQRPVLVNSTNYAGRPHSLYAIDGERCCCNIGGHDTFSDSIRRRLKDCFLLICNKIDLHFQLWISQFKHIKWKNDFSCLSYITILFLSEVCSTKKRMNNISLTYSV